MEDEEEVEEETTSASEESSEDEEEVPEKPATGLEPMGTISVETKEPFVEVEEDEYLPPVTSLDTSDEFLPDISDPGKHISKIYVEIFMLKIFQIPIYGGQKFGNPQKLDLHSILYDVIILNFLQYLECNY